MQWAEDSETLSAYFLPQKARASRRLFTGMRNVHGVIVRSISAILRVWVLFYAHLFAAATLSLADQDFLLIVWTAPFLMRRHLFVKARLRWWNVPKPPKALSGINLLA